jgi:hypothetical protein
MNGSIGELRCSVVARRERPQWAVHGSKFTHASRTVLGLILNNLGNFAMPRHTDRASGALRRYARESGQEAFQKPSTTISVLNGVSGGVNQGRSGECR